MISRRKVMVGALAGVVIPCVTIPTPARADSTATLQAAMNTAVANGLPLVLDPITYTCTRLNVPNGLVMIGAGNPGGYGIAIGAHTKIALANGTNDHLLYGAGSIAHVRISNIHFDGNKNNNSSGDVIRLTNATSSQEAQWHIRDCFIEAGADNGIYVGTNRRAVQISDCTVNYNGDYAVRIQGSDSHVDRCIIGSNLVGGVSVGGAVTNITNCDIYGNGTSGNTGTGDAITINSTITKVAVTNNRIDRNRRHGVFVNPQCDDIIIALNMFHGNSVHSPGTYLDIRNVSDLDVQIGLNAFNPVA